MSTINSLILNSPFSLLTSYGLCGINIALALAQEKIDVQAIPIGNRADWGQNHALQPLLDRGQFFSPHARCIRLYHEFDLASHYGDGWHVGFPIFEKTAFNKQEIHQLNSVDSLFVCTEWAKGVIEDNGIKPYVNVVNLGVDLSVFRPAKPVDGPFRFFYPGKFEIRKSHDIVMEIFERAFTKDDNIEIYFLPFNRFLSEEENKEWSNYLLSSPLRDKIKIIGHLETNEQVASLYNYVDCVVSFSKAEGFNLPLLEGLACGKQVVATNYSAHTEFLTNDNGYLVDVDGLEPMLDEKWFHNPESNWALIGEKCKNGLTEALREVYKGGKRVNEKGIETSKKFTWQNSAKQIISHLKLNT